tara:strand:+ start:898 stop:1017 length:120 start_codon:yes stop_codon:yes gene_type:complete
MKSIIAPSFAKLLARFLPIISAPPELSDGTIIVIFLLLS